jgi:AbrB family looped-hinge helix DNA binding protein
MDIQITIDSAGRVFIPKSVRDELALAPGDSLVLDRIGDTITLRPVRNSQPLSKEKGVWVFRTGGALPIFATDDVVHQIRGERDHHNSGARE